MNDVTMLRWAGMGVAMANAEHADVTAAADRTTVSVDEDGVAVVLEEMLGSAESVRAYVEQRRAL